MEVRIRRRARVGLVCVVALSLACGRRATPTQISGVGSVELTETDVAAMAPGRVARMYVEEGAEVKPGDTLAVLWQSTLGADLDQRRARVTAAESDLRDLEAGARPAELDRLRADLSSADAEATRAAKDAQRMRALVDQGAQPQASLDAAESAARVAAGRRESLKEALRLASEGARPNRIGTARAAVAAARAQLAMGQASAGDLVILAPTHGVVAARHAEQGEILPAGTPIVSLADPTRPWVRIYIPPGAAAVVRAGMPATITLEGLPGRSFTGVVSAINTTAEFTPRVALTEKERADLLFGVRILVSDSSRTLKAGLPATVVIDTSGSGRTR